MWHIGLCNIEKMWRKLDCFLVLIFLLIVQADIISKPGILGVEAQVLLLKIRLAGSLNGRKSVSSIV